MSLRRDIEQECHDLIQVHNLNRFRNKPRLEIWTPGKPYSLHHVGELVVQEHLLLLPGSGLLALVLVPARHNVWWLWLGDVSTHPLVIIERRQYLATICSDLNLEAWLGHQ